MGDLQHIVWLPHHYYLHRIKRGFLGLWSKWALIYFDSDRISNVLGVYDSKDEAFIHYRQHHDRKCEWREKNIDVIERDSVVIPCNFG